MTIHSQKLWICSSFLGNSTGSKTVPSVNVIMIFPLSSNSTFPIPAAGLPFVTVKVVVSPFVKVIVYVSIKPSVLVSLILEIPFPESPFNPLADLPVSTPSICQLPFSIVITGVWPSLPGSPWIPWIPWAPSLPLVTVKVVVWPFEKVIVYVSTRSSVLVNLILDIPFPVSPFNPIADLPVSTPSICQLPFSIVITGVCPSFPGIPWIPWIPWAPVAPSLPFVTVKVVVWPFVKVIVYVSTKPSVDVLIILDIPFPVSPFNPIADLPVSTPSIYQLPFSIVITGVWPSLPGSPWIPWIPWAPVAPSLPFVTVKVVVSPFVNVIVYVSIKPSVLVSLILEIPLPVSPFKPSANTLVLMPSICQ